MPNDISIENPYLSARKEYGDRYGSAVKDAARWRQISIFMVMLCLLFLLLHSIHKILAKCKDFHDRCEVLHFSLYWSSIFVTPATNFLRVLQTVSLGCCMYEVGHDCNEHTQILLLLDKDCLRLHIHEDIYVRSLAY